MLTFKNFYKLNEDASGEMAFIYDTFKSRFDKTTILVYADYIQEHNNEDELAEAIRDTIEKKGKINQRPFTRKLNEVTHRCSHHMNFTLSPNDIIFLPKPYSSIPSLKKAHLYNEHTGEWGVLHNISASSININEIRVEDFRYIDVKQVPQDIVILAFWEYLHNKSLGFPL
jgi:uncharacterized protein (TIGR02996 family)